MSNAEQAEGYEAPGGLPECPLDDFFEQEIDYSEDEQIDIAMFICGLCNGWPCPGGF